MCIETLDKIKGWGETFTYFATYHIKLLNQWKKENSSGFNGDLIATIFAFRSKLFIFLYSLNVESTQAPNFDILENFPVICLLEFLKLKSSKLYFCHSTKRNDFRSITFTKSKHETNTLLNYLISFFYQTRNFYTLKDRFVFYFGFIFSQWFYN